LALISVLSAATARVIGQARPGLHRSDISPIDLPGGSQVKFLEMESQALKGRGRYSIFLPPSYEKESKDYPVVYFLHGMFNDHTSWTVDRFGNLPAKIEQLMTDEEIPEMILVHPDGGKSFYTNLHDQSIKYEDFVVKELPAHVESAYRAKKDRRHRVVAGTSMGGYGALKIAMKYPEIYGGAAAHSPIIFPIPNPMDVPAEVKNSRRYQFFSEVFITVYGNPFDQAYYDANNPLMLAETASRDLALYFDYGIADRYNSLVHMDEGLRKLDRTLTEAGVSHTFREHPGEPHGWALVYSHIEESLGFLSKGF
jgi:enterochelin esterase family protein